MAGNPNPVRNLPLNEDGTIKKTKGRPKGTPNKVTVTFREALIASFTKVGGVKYLVKLAETEPKSYAALLSKLLPTAVQSVDADGNGSPLEIRISYQKPEDKNE